MSHTKEPWEHIPESRGSLPFVVTDASGQREAFYVDHSNGDQIARRIVACVNACAGVPTEYLEKESAMSAGFHMRMQYLRQRDELAEAIRLTLDENGHLADGDVCTLKRLKDALAKVGAGGTAPKGHNA